LLFVYFKIFLFIEFALF